MHVIRIALRVALIPTMKRRRKMRREEKKKRDLTLFSLSGSLHDVPGDAGRVGTKRRRKELLTRRQDWKGKAKGWDDEDLYKVTRKREERRGERKNNLTIIFADGRRDGSGRARKCQSVSLARLDCPDNRSSDDAHRIYLNNNRLKDPWKSLMMFPNLLQLRRNHKVTRELTEILSFFSEFAWTTIASRPCPKTFQGFQT